ncbi:hypothetical protein HDU88_001605 [Geranomyces variabilis]|nr:hypothetical protein HDU88_001605 [Geranomyces variabilis]
MGSWWSRPESFDEKFNRFTALFPPGPSAHSTFETALTDFDTSTIAVKGGLATGTHNIVDPIVDENIRDGFALALALRGLGHTSQNVKKQNYYEAVEGVLGALARGGKWQSLGTLRDFTVDPVDWRSCLDIRAQILLRNPTIDAASLAQRTRDETVNAARALRDAGEEDNQRRAAAASIIAVCKRSYTVSSASDLELKRCAADTVRHFTTVGAPEWTTNRMFVERIDVDRAIIISETDGGLSGDRSTDTFLGPSQGGKGGTSTHTSASRKVFMFIKGTASWTDWTINADTAPLPESFGDQTFTGHGGFLKASRGIWRDNVKPTIERLAREARAGCADMTSGTVVDVFVVGHSLGGALSQTIGLHAATHGDVRRVTLMTIASPAVFDEESAGRIDALVKKLSHHRLFNPKDPVPNAVETARHFFPWTVVARHFGVPSQMRCHSLWDRFMMRIPWYGCVHAHKSGTYLRMKRSLEAFVPEVALVAS